MVGLGLGRGFGRGFGRGLGFTVPQTLQLLRQYFSIYVGLALHCPLLDQYAQFLLLSTQARMVNQSIRDIFYKTYAQFKELTIRTATKSEIILILDKS